MYKLDYLICVSFYSPSNQPLEKIDFIWWHWVIMGFCLWLRLNCLFRPTNPGTSTQVAPLNLVLSYPPGKCRCQRKYPRFWCLYGWNLLLASPHLSCWTWSPTCCWVPLVVQDHRASYTPCVPRTWTNPTGRYRLDGVDWTRLRCRTDRRGTSFPTGTSSCAWWNHSFGSRELGILRTRKQPCATHG